MTVKKLYGRTKSCELTVCLVSTSGLYTKKYKKKVKMNTTRFCRTHHRFCRQPSLSRLLFLINLSGNSHSLDPFQIAISFILLIFLFHGGSGEIIRTFHLKNNWANKCDKLTHLFRTEVSGSSPCLGTLLSLHPQLIPWDSK